MNTKYNILSFCLERTSRFSAEAIRESNNFYFILPWFLWPFYLVDHRIEKNVGDKINIIISNLENLSSNVKETIREVARLASETKDLGGKVTQLTLRVDNMSAGLGKGIECLSAEWLKFIFKKRGINDAEVLTGFKFKDPEALSQGGEFDMDVYCKSPLAIMECTSFLKRTEIPKLKKFARAKRILEEREGLPCEAFFVTYGMDPKIRAEAYGILERSGIIYIDALSELK